MYRVAISYLYQGHWYSVTATVQADDSLEAEVKAINRLLSTMLVDYVVDSTQPVHYCGY